jgi:3-phosphoshikimate 1-carboxyvinyltransferase
MNKTISPFKYNGQLKVNSSKSYAQRAFILSLLATDETIIYNSDQSKDVLAIQNCIRQLGAEIIVYEEGLKIIPPPRKKIDSVSLNVGESGLALRMLGIVATLFSSTVYLSGKGSILNRSQKQLIDILEQLGLSVTHQNYKLPLLIKGQISNQNLVIDASEGSQVISGLLISLPLLNNPSTLNLVNITSRPYLEMTCEIMSDFGIPISTDFDTKITIEANQFYQSNSYSIEGDWSGAANHLVGAAISGSVKLIGLNSKSKQADALILSVLNEFGAIIRIDNSAEGREFIQLHESDIKNPFKIDLTDAPDLFPILSVLACAAKGKSTISGTNRLLNKESNRLEAISEMLKSFSVEFEVGNNSISIQGTGKIIPNQIINTYSDHRIAMAATIATCLSDIPIELNDINCVKKSYTNFFKDTEKVKYHN